VFSQFVGPPQQTVSHPTSANGRGGLNTWRATHCSAERDAPAARHGEQLSLGKRSARRQPAQRCLTPRSSGAPTAGHQARAGGTVYIFTGPGLASCRRRPLSSNVRPQNHTSALIMLRSLLLGLLLLAGFALAQPTLPKLYVLNPAGWQRNTTPNGEVFTCSICEAQVQLQIDVGPPIGADAKFKTNDQFLAQLKSLDQQRKFADAMLRNQIPLQSGFKITIERTGLTKIGGQDAFQYMAVVEMKPTATRDTTMFLLYKGRLVKISVNYYDGTFSPKAREALEAILSSFKFI
jgi:hypothetical protein